MPIIRPAPRLSERETNQRKEGVLSVRKHPATALSTYFRQTQACFSRAGIDADLLDSAID
jgi:hypothetical protein